MPSPSGATHFSLISRGRDFSLSCFLMNRRRFVALNFLFSAEEFLAPRFAQTLRTFINGVADAEAVIAGTAFIAGKLPALRTRIKRHGLGSAVFVIKHMFANDTH